MTLSDSDQYDLFLIRAALKWGSSDPDEARRAHEIIETSILEDKKRPQKIRLFTYNGQYGYCLDIRLKGQWSTYGPFLGFSDPYSQADLRSMRLFLKSSKRPKSTGGRQKSDGWGRGRKA